MIKREKTQQQREKENEKQLKRISRKWNRKYKLDKIISSQITSILMLAGIFIIILASSTLTIFKEVLFIKWIIEKF